MSVLVAFLFVGYTLVYAAVADGGSSARTPWETLRGGVSGSEAAGGQEGGGSSLGRIVKAGLRIVAPGVPQP